MELGFSALTADRAWNWAAHYLDHPLRLPSRASQPQWSCPRPRRPTPSPVQKSGTTRKPDALLLSARAHRCPLRLSSTSPATRPLGFSEGPPTGAIIRNKPQSTLARRPRRPHLPTCHIVPPSALRPTELQESANRRHRVPPVQESGTTRKAGSFVGVTIRTKSATWMASVKRPTHLAPTCYTYCILASSRPGNL